MKLLHKISWKTVIISTLIFIIFLLFILPVVSNYTISNIGVEESPDMSFVYNKTDLYNIAEQYGETGRQTYIKIRWTFDVIWPLVYTFFLLTLITKLSISLSEKKWIRNLYLVPFLAMIFDYFENIGVTIIMSRYPTITPSIDSIIPIISTIKWGFIIAGYIIGAILLILFIFKRIRRK